VDGGDDVDWRLFLSLAQFHRVQGLAWHPLYSASYHVPDAVAEHLRSDAEAIAATNLRASLESREIRDQFEKAGIALLFVKGLTLGGLAYSNPMLKMSWDIDLLIDEKQLQPAAELLRDRGYRQILPRSAARLAVWHRRQKESIWKRDELHVELHTRLADNRALIPGIDVHSPCEEVEILPGISLPTLARDELVAYLGVHGASSAWFRLKWTADFAALLHASRDIERLYRRSQELGAGRAGAQAFLLADALYDSLRGTNLRSKIEQDPTARWLASAALKQITRQTEPTEARFGTARIHLTQLLLRPGMTFKIGELWRQTSAAVASRRSH
jgi:hypothetical protein